MILSRFIDSFLDWAKFKKNLLDLNNPNGERIIFNDLLNTDAVKNFFSVLKTNPNIYFQEGAFYLLGDKRPYRLSVLISKLKYDLCLSKYVLDIILARIGIYISFLKEKENISIRLYNGLNAIYLYPQISSCMSCIKNGIQYINPCLLNLVLNQDKLSLVVLTNKTTQKSLARAYLWKLDSGMVLLDRIYPLEENSHWFIFYELAKQNNWITRDSNRNEGSWLLPKFDITLRHFQKIPLPFFDSLDITSFSKDINNIYRFYGIIKKLRLNEIVSFLEQEITNPKIIEKTLPIKDHMVDEETIIYLGNKYKSLSNSLPIMEVSHMESRGIFNVSYK